VAESLPADTQAMELPSPMLPAVVPVDPCGVMDLSSDALEQFYNSMVSPKLTAAETVFDSSLHPLELHQQSSSNANVRGGEAHIGGTAKRQKRKKTSLACPVCTM